MTDILVSEVGPRDGLQSIKAVLPTEAKKAAFDRWPTRGQGGPDPEQRALDALSLPAPVELPGEE